MAEQVGESRLQRVRRLVAQCERAVTEQIARVEGYRTNGHSPAISAQFLATYRKALSLLQNELAAAERDEKDSQLRST